MLTSYPFPQTVYENACFIFYPLLKICIIKLFTFINGIGKYIYIYIYSYWFMCISLIWMKLSIIHIFTSFSCNVHIHILWYILELLAVFLFICQISFAKISYHNIIVFNFLFALWPFLFITLKIVYRKNCVVYIVLICN